MTSSNENTPVGRPSIAEAPLHGPMPLFEHHLKYLSDSYLMFFLERVKIEEAYVDSLYRLHKKAKAIDAYLDERVEPSTVRQVWAEVRDGVEREAQTREAFLSALTKDVVNPISALKETQDRTRKRIKEDIKESSLAYNEYADNVLPRTKRAYLKKCQEVEENKAAANAANANPPAQFESPALAPSRSNPGFSTVTPVVTSPQPLRPLSRRASGHHAQPQPRNRSPSTTNPLQDLAHQGKRQLNQLMTFLDNKGGGVKEGLAAVKGDATVRTVRAKRDADEADKEYRRGVHWLETLRLRRLKILEGAFKSLELFIQESAQTLKTVLEKYTENSIATSTTQTHLAEHARDQVMLISPPKDIAFIALAMPRFLQQAVPRQTLYTNYHVGDCNDLIFGVGLVDYANARGLQDGEIPRIVKLCIAEVDQRGLNSEGVYRVPGKMALVQTLMHKIEKDENNFQFDPRTDDVFAVASLLKQYLRELPEPVFRFPLEDRVKHSEDRNEHVNNNFLFLRGKMRRLPPVHFATLKAVVEHLARVAAHSEKNKMDAKNLAIIFSSVTFGEDEIPKTADLLSIQSWKDSLMEDLITHATVLFDDKSFGQICVPSPATTPATSTSTLTSPALSLSHPLPPAPHEEPVTYTYGSSYTQVASVPPRHRADNQVSSQGTGTGHDFTPQLPPRPGNSIHPSRRAGGQGNRIAPVAPTSIGAASEDELLASLPNPYPQGGDVDSTGHESDGTDLATSNAHAQASSAIDGVDVQLGTPTTEEAYATAPATPPSPVRSLGGGHSRQGSRSVPTSPPR